MHSGSLKCHLPSTFRLLHAVFPPSRVGSHSLTQMSPPGQILCKGQSLRPLDSIQFHSSFSRVFWRNVSQSQSVSTNVVRIFKGYTSLAVIIK